MNFEREYGKPLPERPDQAQFAAAFREKLEALNGATVRTLHAAGRQQVVASGSPRERRRRLEKAGLMRSSNQIEFSRGKTWRRASPSRTCS